MDDQELAPLVDAKRQDDPWGNFYWSRVSLEHKYLWVCVPKVASVTTAITLRDLDGNPFSDGALWEDEGVTKLKDFATPEIVEMLSSPDWFRFCFVRNPYDRLFSAYKSKIMWRHAEDIYQAAQQEVREAYDYPTHDGERVGTVAFRDFVKYVTSGARRGDGHWCVQSGRLMTEMISYDFIGRFETFAADLARVLERLHAPDAVSANASVVRGQSTKVPLAAAYDRELASSVYEWYRKDFELFGYQKDSWMFENPDA